MGRGQPQRQGERVPLRLGTDLRRRRPALHYRREPPFPVTRTTTGTLRNVSTNLLGKLFIQLSGSKCLSQCQDTAALDAGKGILAEMGREKPTDYEEHYNRRGSRSAQEDPTASVAINQPYRKPSELTG